MTIWWHSNKISESIRCRDTRYSFRSVFVYPLAHVPSLIPTNRNHSKNGIHNVSPGIHNTLVGGARKVNLPRFDGHVLKRLRQACGVESHLKINTTNVDRVLLSIRISFLRLGAKNCSSLTSRECVSCCWRPSQPPDSRSPRGPGRPRGRPTLRVQVILAFPLNVLKALQEGVFHNLHLANHILRTMSTFSPSLRVERQKRYQSREYPDRGLKKREPRRRSRVRHQPILSVGLDQQLDTVSPHLNRASVPVTTERQRGKRESSRVIDGRWHKLPRAFPTPAASFKAEKMISFRPHSSTSDVSDLFQPTPISSATNKDGHIPAEVEAAQATTKAQPRCEQHLDAADRSQPEPQSLQSPRRGEIERPRVHLDSTLAKDAWRLEAERRLSNSSRNKEI